VTTNIYPHYDYSGQQVDCYFSVPSWVIKIGQKIINGTSLPILRVISSWESGRKNPEGEHRTIFSKEGATNPLLTPVQPSVDYQTPAQNTTRSHSAPHYSTLSIFRHKPNSAHHDVRNKTFVVRGNEGGKPGD
jgi:hypothetical protein